MSSSQFRVSDRDERINYEKKVSKPDDSKANNVSKLKNSKDEDMQGKIDKYMQSK